MRRNAALLVVVLTVVAVHVVFSTATYHVSDIKTFLLLAGLATLIVALVARSAWMNLRDDLSPGLPRLMFAGVAAYVLLAVLSVLWARYREAAGFRAGEVVIYAAWGFCVFLALRTRRDVLTAMGAFLVSGVAAALIAFAFGGLYLLDPKIYPEHGAKQFFLPMGNSNWLADAMLIPMMGCVAGFCRSILAKPRDWGKAGLFVAGFVFMALTIWKAGSHSAAAALAIALVVFPLLTGARRRWVIAGCVAGAIALACVADLARGSSSALRHFAASKSVAIRLDMWRWGLTLAKRNPVSGLGAGAYFPNIGEVAAPDFDARPGYFADIEVHAHNEYLEILTELGVFGLIAFLWPVGVALYGVYRRARDDADSAFRLSVAAFAAGWLAILLQSSLDVGMRFENVPVAVWAGVGVLATSLRLTGRASEAEPEAVPAPRRTVIVAAVAAGLVAAILIVTGLRGAIEMKQALIEPDAAKRIADLRAASSCELSFVDRVRATNELGRQLDDFGAPRKASDAFHDVLRMAGFYHDTERRLGVTLLEQDRVDEAVRALAGYARLRPADPRTADALLSWMRRGDPAEAMARATKLVHDYPDFPKVYIAAGLLALQFDPPDDASARANFERALAADPTDPQALWHVGFERLKAREIAEARRLIEAACARGFRSVDLVVNLARLRAGMGDTESSRSLLLEGRQLFPDSKRILQEIDNASKQGD